jgi:flavin-dependent dehydrogenase
MLMAPAPYFQGQLLSHCNEANGVKIDQDNRSNETQASKKLGQEGHRKYLIDADGACTILSRPATQPSKASL